MLIVDAAQGVEAQTMAPIFISPQAGTHPHSGHQQRSTCPTPTSSRVKKQLEDVLSIPADEAILASAKNGIGISDILEAIIERIPPPPTYKDDYSPRLGLRFHSSTLIAAWSPMSAPFPVNSRLARPVS